MKRKICILLGSAHVGGGTFVIFQHALWLTKNGFDVTVVPHFPVSPGALDWHPEAKAQLKFKDFNELGEERFDLALATWWRTAYDLPRINSDKYGYFIQSIESKFFKPEDAANRLLAEATYMFRLPVITEVSWIKTYLKDNYDINAGLALNGVRKDLFTPTGESFAPRLKSGLRVLVEGPLGVFFKNTERTLKLCQDSRADEIWFLTSTPGLTSFPGVDRTFSCIPITETPKIYRSTDLIVKLSYVEGMFGPPLEQFHCGGTAIVYKVTGGEEYLVHDHNSVILNKDDEEGVIQSINSFRDDPVRLAQFKSHALDTASTWPSWDEASKRFGAGIEQMLNEDSPSRSSLRFMSHFLMEQYNAVNCKTASHAAIGPEVEAELNRLRKLEGMLGSILESKTMQIAAKVRQVPGLYSIGKKLLGIGRRVSP